MLHVWIPEWAIVDEGLNIGVDGVFSETFIAHDPSGLERRWLLDASAIPWVPYVEQGSPDGWQGETEDVHVWAPVQPRPEERLIVVADFEGAAPVGFPRCSVRATEMFRVTRSEDGSLASHEVDGVSAASAKSMSLGVGFIVGVRPLLAS